MKPTPIKTFALTMILVAAILNLRTLPMMAHLGISAVFFYIVAAITFLIPSSCVCAELAAAIPKNGGIYAWVSTAFNHRAGFLAIWLEWINNIIAFPATLAAIVATIAYIGMPYFATNKYAIFILMVIILWLCTFYNMLGIKALRLISIFGAIFGTLAPAALIIILGIIWVLKGLPIYLTLDYSHLLPQWNLASVAIFVAILASFSGMQVTAFHAENVKNPAKSFPRANLGATILILLVSIFVVLSIATVIPSDKVNIINGVIESFNDFFIQFHMSWFVPILAALIALAGITNLCAWLISPARGIHYVATKNHLPGFFKKTNGADMPINILLLQGIIGTILALAFILMPSLKSAFYLLVALTSQFTVMMYILVFASAIRLRYNHKNLARPYKIYGKNIGMWIIASLGITACTIGFCFGFIIPEQLHISNHLLFVSLVIITDVIVIALGLISC